MALSSNQKLIWIFFRDTCQGLRIGMSTYQHRLPEGTTTPNTGGAGGAARNSEFVEDSGVRLTPNVQSYQVWATWQQQELKVGSHDAGDSPAFAAWMLRAKGMMPAFDQTGDTLPVQDEDWLLDPRGVLMRMENPVLSPDGLIWTFEMWSQR